jgi:hypothetical protein
MRFVLSIMISLMLCSGAMAESKYSTWSNPDQPGGTASQSSESLSKIIGELNVLVDEAEKARAADPVFLRDLRALARRYSNPWGHLALSDDFSDGNFTANPTWLVSGGKIVLQKGWGLRTALAPKRIAASDTRSSDQSGNVTGRDAAVAIIGAILNQSSGESSGQTTPTAPASQSRFSRLHTAAPIGNAFSLAMEVSSWHAHVPGKGDVRLDVGPYFRGRNDVGYRLSYTSGDPIRLLRAGMRGSSVVQQSSKRFTFEDRKTHLLLWTRDINGNMKVSVDGQVVLTAMDREFSQDFSGLTVLNRGGDFIVKNVAVYDAR